MKNNEERSGELRRHVSCTSMCGTDMSNYKIFPASPDAIFNAFITTAFATRFARCSFVRKHTKHHRGFLNTTLTRADLERAKLILASFDLVLITEQMSSNPDMMR